MTSRTRHTRNCGYLPALLAVTLLAGCGGGGGGSGGGGPVGGGGGGITVPPTPAPAPLNVPTAELDAANSGKFGGALLQTVQLTRELVEFLRPGIGAGIVPGSTSTPCELGGTVQTELSANLLQLTERFSACRVQLGAEAATIDGLRTRVYSASSTVNGFTADVGFAGWRITDDAGDFEENNGTIRYVAGAQQNFEPLESMAFDLQVESSREGVLRLQDVVIDFRNSLIFAISLADVTGASGSIAHDTQGQVELGFDAAEDAVTLAGAGTGVGVVELRGSGLTVTYRPDGAAPATAFLELDRDDLLDIEFFNETNRFGPLRISSFVSDLDNILTLQQDTLGFSLRRNFSDGDGDLLTLSLNPTAVQIRDRNGFTEDLAPDDARVELNVSEVEAGIFEATSATDGETVTYAFDVFAEDPTGLTSLDALEIAFAIYRDTDADGTADRFDDDDDNDGVNDFSDEFPLDATETTDSDRDGIGDNADPDDDNDGTPDVDDAYPFDDKCFLATDGDGTRCTLSGFDWLADVRADRDGIAYIYDDSSFVSDPHTVYRLDTNTGHFIEPMQLDPSIVGLDPADAPYFITYVVDHHALYVAYDNAGITKIDLADPGLTETLFKTPEPTSQFLGRATDFSPYVVTSEQVMQVVSRFSFDAAGAQIDAYTWPDGFGGPEFTQAANASFCDEGVTLDIATGTFFEYSNPGLVACRFLGEPVPSPDGSIALTQQLEIIDSNGTVLANIDTRERPRGAFAWAWTPDGIFLPSNAGVEVFAADGSAVTVVQPATGNGDFDNVTVHRGDDRLVVVFRTVGDGLRIQPYAPPP